MTSLQAKIVEIPVGKYDAVRTLRHTLQLAERGEISNVIIICTTDDDDDDGHDIWAVWSDMTRYKLLWFNRWFNSWINKQYFHDYHED